MGIIFGLELRIVNHCISLKLSLTATIRVMHAALNDKAVDLAKYLFFES